MNSVKRWIVSDGTCPHCAPHSSNHFLTKYVVRVSSFFFPFPAAISRYSLGRLRNIWRLCADWCADTITRLLLFLCIAKANPIENVKNILTPHMRLIADECFRRRLPLFMVSIFGAPTPRFFIATNNSKRFFDELPIPHGREKHPFADKAYVREALLKHAIPVARGAVLKHFRHAYTYLNVRYTFPLVVKPRYGSLSRHITLDVRSTEELRSAIAIAQGIDSNFIVEEQVPGNVFRAVLINGKFVACARREPRYLIGDGIQTVKELADIAHASGALLSAFALSEMIPKRGEKIYIETKMTGGHKPVIHDVTDDVHEDIRELLERVATIFSAKLIGIDFIAEDVTLPYTKQSFAVLEVNGMPHIALHDNPMTGKSRAVAGPLLDAFLGPDIL